MIFKILLSYIYGYINISVEGYFIERFINMCISKRILLWNTKREKSTYLQTNIRIKDFKRIRNVAKKTKCRIAINRKKGMPFILNRYKKRKIFALALLIIMLTIMVTSRYIWNIEVLGNEKIETKQILEQLNAEGIAIGARKSKIDTNEIIRKIRLERNDIAWMSIDLNGTNAIIKIVENIEKPEIIDKNDYCNIVADKSGVITKINSKSGTSLVKIGDVVTQDTILVGGWMEGKYTGIRYVHSEAEIEARVWYEASKSMTYKQIEEVKTGNCEKKYSIKLNNFQINLYKSLPNFKKYDTINERKRLKIFSNFYLPIELGIDQYKEITTIEKTYTREELKEIMLEELEKQLSDEISDTTNIINKQINEKEIDGGIEVQLIYEVLEKIGVKKKLDTNIQ